MGKVSDKSGAYVESDMVDPNTTSRPIPAPGIGHRIGEAASVLGTRTSAYKLMGISSAALQRYINEENQPPFSPLARLCVAAGVRMEWLATGEGEMRIGAESGEPPAAHAVRQETLMLAMQLASEALGEKTLPPAKYAELVSLLYELLEEGLPEATVLRFARAAA